MAWLEHRKHALPKGHDVLNHYDTPHTGGIYKTILPLYQTKQATENRFVPFRPHPPRPSIPTSVRVERTNVGPPSLPPVQLSPLIKKWGKSAERTEKTRSISHQPFLSFPFPFPFPPLYPSTNHFVLIPIRQPIHPIIHPVRQVTKE